MPDYTGNIGSHESASNSLSGKILRLPDGKLVAGVVRDLLDYEPVSGFLTWKWRDLKYCSSEQSQAAVNARIAGKRAFTAINTGGYYQGAILRTQCLAHRVIWVWMTGGLPDDCIDHINRDVLDNSWMNLRQATRSQNQANRSAYNGSASRYLGVSRRGDKWSARITANYRDDHLGTFLTEMDAAKAYDAAAVRLHGEFANLNFPKVSSARQIGGAA